MTPQLNNELEEAVATHPEGAIQVQGANGTYWIMTNSAMELHQQAMQTLRQQEDRAAIAEGIRQMEAGQGQPLDEAFDDINRNLGLPASQ